MTYLSSTANGTSSTELVKIIREAKPQVVITYDDFGGYGHPDHINAHRITHYASDLAKVSSYKPELGDAWEISKIYWTCIPKSQIQKGIDALASSGSKFFGVDSVDEAQAERKRMIENVEIQRDSATKVAAEAAKVRRSLASASTQLRQALDDALAVATDIEQKTQAVADKTKSVKDGI